MRKPYSHYIFGDFVPGALTKSKLDSILIKAQKIKNTFIDYPIDKIIHILDRVGKLWQDRKYPPRTSAITHMPSLVGFHPQMVELAIDTLANLLRRENLEKKLMVELHLKRYLDDWIFEPSFGGLLRAKPLGILLHVSAGNIFISGIDSLVHGLLTKNVNLLKFSGTDPIFPMLFAKSLLDGDDEGIVSRSFSLLSFRAKESTIEDTLKEKCDGIVVWGGESAVLSYRKNLPINTRLIEYGPKYSISIITQKGLEGADVEEVCSSIAIDAVMWEQRACSSPQAIYMEEKSRKILSKFLTHLESAMKKISSSIPQGKLTIDEEIEILKARELGTMNMIYEEGEILYSQGNTDYTIILEHSPEFKLSPLNRCLYIKPYHKWDEVKVALSPIGPFLQTVSVLGAQDELEDITKDLIKLGATRITALGKAHKGKIGGPHDGSYQLGQLISWASIESADLLKRQVSSGKEQHALLYEEAVRIDERIDTLLQYAKFHSPFYNRMITHSFREFHRIPFLEKADIYKNTPPKGTDLLTGPLEHAFIFASGGSTGAPKFCFYHYNEFDYVADILAKIYRVAGIVDTDIAGNLFMAGNLWTSFLAANRALEKTGCITLPIGGNADIELILKYLHLFKPTVLIGLPSIIIQLAERIKKRKSLTINKILYGGEHLCEETSKFIKYFFGTEIIRSAGYASVDAGPVGFQCPSCPGTIHHLLTDYQYLEIVDRESGEILPPGSIGEIVVTNLQRRLFPIIRYRTGDLGRIIDEKCSCGRKAPLLELLGRCDDVIRVGSVSIHPDEIESLLDKTEGVSHIFQIVTKSEGRKDHLIVYIEALEDLTDHVGVEELIRNNLLERNIELREALRREWLGSLNVNVVPRGSIPRVPRTGKIKKVVDLRSCPDSSGMILPPKGGK